MSTKLFKQLELKRKIITVIVFIITAVLFIKLDLVIEKSIYKKLTFSELGQYLAMLSLGLSLVIDVMTILLIGLLTFVMVWVLSIASTILYTVKILSDSKYTQLDVQKSTDKIHKVMLGIEMILVLINFAVFIISFVNNSFKINEIETISMCTMIEFLITLIINEIQYRVFKYSEFRIRKSNCEKATAVNNIQVDPIILRKDLTQNYYINER
jgi:hypothetical protein